MSNKQKLLIVDDEKINIDILLELLSDKYDIIAALGGEQALKILDMVDIDLILLDITMPKMDGFELCKILKSKEKTKCIPIVFITANSDEDSIEKAFDVGGVDYVTKPFRSRELLVRVKTQLKIKNMQDEFKLLASIDPMTKLYNRRYFSKISEHIVDLAKRDNQEVSLLMVDIDKFKIVNDTYGHDVGDKVIIHLANKLKSYQRKSDIACRFGGEEFVVLLPNTSIDGAKIVSQKIRKDIEKSTLEIDENIKINYTLSIGVTNIDMSEKDTITKALKKVDLALYKAKEGGRNRVCVV